MNKFSKNGHTPCYASGLYFLPPKKAIDQAIAAGRSEIFLTAAAGGMRRIPRHAFRRITLAVMMPDLSGSGELG